MDRLFFAASYLKAENDRLLVTSLVVLVFGG
jgi:hypothetical protein